MKRACDNRGIKTDDPFDWDSYVTKYKNDLSSQFGVNVDDMIGDVNSGSFDIAGLVGIVDIPGIEYPLIKNRQRRESTTMQLSELNERDSYSCCC